MWCCNIDDEKWKTGIESYTFINERIIITVHLKSVRGYLLVVDVYAPEYGKKAESEEFYEELQKIIMKFNLRDHIIIAGDRNAQVGNQCMSKIVGTFEENQPIITANSR